MDGSRYWLLALSVALAIVGYCALKLGRRGSLQRHFWLRSCGMFLVGIGAICLGVPAVTRELPVITSGEKGWIQVVQVASLAMWIGWTAIGLLLCGWAIARVYIVGIPHSCPKRRSKLDKDRPEVRSQQSTNE
jgi:heme/copper-type cytochrome/quinol oxidase subunit 1